MEGNVPCLGKRFLSVVKAARHPEIKQGTCHSTKKNDF